VVEAPLPLAARLAQYVGSRGSGGEFGGPDLDALYRWDAAHRLGNHPVELSIPVHVTAKSGGNMRGDHVRRSPERVAVLARRVDRGDHSRRGRLISAAHGCALDR